MKKQLLHVVLTLFGTGSSFGQPVKFDWAKSFGGPNYESGLSIAVDAFGNVYTTGGFSETVDFDPGNGDGNLVSSGSNDIYVQKMDALGNFLWAKRFGGTSLDLGQSIAVDGSGNVYTTGYFSETADFDPSAGVATLFSFGSSDIFVQKMDASGNFLWAKAFGGAYLDDGQSTVVDASGNVYTTGWFQNTVDFDPGEDTTILSPKGYSDIFVQKMDANGNFLWAKAFGGGNGDAGYSISVDASGNVYTTGIFTDTADFDPGTGTANLTAAGEADIFVQKMDASGNFLWARGFGGEFYDDGRSITVDASDNVYTTGFFWKKADFDPGQDTVNLNSWGEYDIFVQKMDASGNFQWAKRFGGTSNDAGQSIKVDGSGNVYTMGNFQETVDFDPGPDTANLSSKGLRDIFVHKMDASGNFQWVHRFGGPSDDAARSIVVDSSKHVYISGDFQGTADFDPRAGISNLTSVGDADIFVQKMSPMILTPLGQELLSIADLQVFPNPNEGTFRVRAPKAEVQITITDALGRMVIQEEIADAFDREIQLTKKGLYVLTMRYKSGNSSINTKVLVK